MAKSDPLNYGLEVGLCVSVITVVSSIRLRYAAEGLFAKRNYCRSALGPNAKWILPAADHLVWTALDASSPPLVKPRPVALEKDGEELAVELELPGKE
jgi:hypothetical protein